MAFHNSPDGYRGVQPNDEHVIGSGWAHIPPIESDGLFYRSDVQIDLDSATERMLSPDGQARLQDYQYWSETGWKKPHGTYEAVERFGDKLYEEHEEFSAELRNGIDNDLEPNPEAIVSEAGDVLWCATALACVANADIDSGLKNLLYRYVMGIQHVHDMQLVEAPWRQTAAGLATKFGQLTIGDVDSLIASGFEPQPSAIMNIFDPRGDEWDTREHLMQSLGICAALRNTTETQFGYGERAESEFALYQTSGAFKDKARQIGELVAGLYLETTFILHRTTSVGLACAIAENVTKISGRIYTNTVDKTDGERT